MAKFTKILKNRGGYLYGSQKLGVATHTSDYDWAIPLTDANIKLLKKYGFKQDGGYGGRKYGSNRARNARALVDLPGFEQEQTWSYRREKTNVILMSPLAFKANKYATDMLCKYGDEEKLKTKEGRIEGYQEYGLQYVGKSFEDMQPPKNMGATEYKFKAGDKVQENKPGHKLTNLEVIQGFERPNGTRWYRLVAVDGYTYAFDEPALEHMPKHKPPQPKYKESTKWSPKFKRGDKVTPTYDNSTLQKSMRDYWGETVTVKRYTHNKEVVCESAQDKGEVTIDEKNLRLVYIPPHQEKRKFKVGDKVRIKEKRGIYTVKRYYTKTYGGESCVFVDCNDETGAPTGGYYEHNLTPVEHKFKAGDKVKIGGAGDTYIVEEYFTQNRDEYIRVKNSDGKIVSGGWLESSLTLVETPKERKFKKGDKVRYTGNDKGTTATVVKYFTDTVLNEEFVRCEFENGTGISWYEENLVLEEKKTPKRKFQEGDEVQITYTGEHSKSSTACARKHWGDVLIVKGYRNLSPLDKAVVCYSSNKGKCINFSETYLERYVPF